jgi:hypothetical protein
MQRWLSVFLYHATNPILFASQTSQEINYSFDFQFKFFSGSQQRKGAGDGI